MSKPTISMLLHTGTAQTGRLTDWLTLSTSEGNNLVTAAHQHKIYVPKRTELCFLQIVGATEEDAGSYLCSISNVLEERWTEAIEVHISMSYLPPLLSA